MDNNKTKWSQFFTPVWAAEMLFTKHFSNLTENDLVWEPTCGTGSCLKAIPAHIPAIGTEIDPALIPLAIAATHRPVYQGDFLTVDFPQLNRVSAMFGNPPFSCDVFEQFMLRCSGILQRDKKAGFILPAYFFQTSATLLRFARKWDIHQEMLPRDLFKGLSKPLMFASFIRSDSPKLFGFSLYKELMDVKSMREFAQEALRRSTWKEVVIDVVRQGGGSMKLEDVYEEVRGKRPTENPFWKEQIRKVIQKGPFERIDNATYKLTI